jgi:hypothetical protein
MTSTETDASRENAVVASKETHIMSPYHPLTSWLARLYGSARAARARRLMPRMGSAVVAFTVICLAACAPAGAAMARHLHGLVLHLPRTAVEAEPPTSRAARVRLAGVRLILRCRSWSHRMGPGAGDDRLIGVPPPKARARRAHPLHDGTGRRAVAARFG